MRLVLLAVATALSAAAWASCAVGALADEPPAADERIHVELRIAEGGAGLSDLAALRALGFEPELTFPDLGRAQGWIAASQLEALRGSAGVRDVATPNYAVYARGSAVSEGDAALGAEAARERFGIDGAGVRVAVISDGIRGLAAAQERGDAPALVEAVGFGSGWLERGSEGTAMIELVHDLAPGAAISFGAVTTDLDMIAAVRHFAERVDVIVDDVGFLYPDDQQSDVSRNTEAALANPDWPLRAYITAAGNWAQTHWAGQFTRSTALSLPRLPSPGVLHDWSPGNPINRFRLAQGARVLICLHWDEPWGRSVHDYDLYLVNQAGTVMASSTLRQAIDTLNPREVLTYTNERSDGLFGIVVQNWRGAATALKLELFVLGSTDQSSMETLQISTAESSLLAQSDAGGGVITVAAITPSDNGLEETASYSSQGPTNNGAPKPDIAAIDGVRISGATDFGSRFYGTSAAAPHVAAVAALVLQAQPSLLAADGGTPAIERQILHDLLLQTAVDIGPSGRDNLSGAGRVNAEQAIAAARGRVALVTSAADRGAGSLREAIGQVNAGQALYIAFDPPAEGRQPVITLDSPLPPLRRDGARLDGAGWRLDARSAAVGITVAGEGAALTGIEVVGASDAGIAVTGEGARLIDVRAARNGRGLLIDAPAVELERVAAVGNRNAGIVVAAGGSGQITRSWIGVEASGEANGNGSAGILLQEGAGALVIGAAEGLPPTASDAPPIAPLRIRELEPRSGRVHVLRGVLLIDGLPAEPGTTIELWLDRRSVGTAVVDEAAAFNAAIAGPGSLIRFSVDGAPLAERIAFEPGGVSRPLLRLSTAGGAAELDLGNQIAYNSGPAVVTATPTASATLRGNLIWSNGAAWIARANAPDEIPRIAGLTFQRNAVSLVGGARGAVSVDLYAGRGEEPPRYLASAPISEWRFRFDQINAGDADRFWVVSHGPNGGALGVSAGWAAAAPPQIQGVLPNVGGYIGGQLVTISGQRFRVDDEAPRVFIGGAEASVRFADNERIVVAAPSTNWRGATDVAVLRSDGRAAATAGIYVYDETRRLPLQDGWNAATWLGPSTRITAAIASIARQAVRVHAWDSEAQRWLGFSPEVPSALNTLRQLRTGDVVWILIDSEQDVVWEQPLTLR